MTAVPGYRLLIAYWLPVAAWMTFIFLGSTGGLASEQTSRFLIPFLKWLLPGAAPETLHQVHVFSRKCAHLAEYALLSTLLWRALHHSIRRQTAAWRWDVAGWALLGAALYAVSDEIHQSFVPSRQGSVRDVLLDSTGAALGLLLVWLAGYLRRRW